MKLLIKGIDLAGKSVTEQIDTTYVKSVWSNPKDFGFISIKNIKEMKDNNKRVRVRH